MTQQSKDTLESIKAQLVPVLLSIIGFFLYQMNAKIDDAILEIKNNTIQRTKAEVEVYELQKDVSEIKLQLSVMNGNIAEFYEEYGYLFSDETREKLSKKQ